MLLVGTTCTLPAASNRTVVPVPPTYLPFRMVPFFNSSTSALEDSCAVKARNARRAIAILFIVVEGIAELLRFLDTGRFPLPAEITGEARSLLGGGVDVLIIIERP